MRRPRLRLLGWLLPNPDLAGGFGLVAVALLVSCLGSCVAALDAKGQEQRPARRTAEWYARPENDAARGAVVEVCRADPAFARQDHDCINAQAAQARAAEREGRLRLDLTPPSDPRYWRDRPQEREHHLRIVCPRVTPLEQRLLHCDVARRS